MVLRSCWKSRHKTSRGAAVRPVLPAALLWFCVTRLACAGGALAETNIVVQKEAEFDVTYNDTATSENQTIYAFNHTVSRNKVSSRRPAGGHTHTHTHFYISDVKCVDFVSFPWESVGGRARVRGRFVTGLGESHPVRGAAEASGAVFSNPPHSKRPVSIPTPYKRDPSANL